MNGSASWEAYLTGLCLDTWSLDPASTIQVVRRLEALRAPGAINEANVATVLRRAGISESLVGLSASRICAAIAA